MIQTKKRSKNLFYQIFILIVSNVFNHHPLSFHSPSLFLGAHFTMSSTLKIISAASVAETRAYSFTLKHSVTPRSFILSTFPVNMLRPASKSPLVMTERRF